MQRNISLRTHKLYDSSEDKLGIFKDDSNTVVRNLTEDLNLKLMKV